MMLKAKQYRRNRQKNISGLNSHRPSLQMMTTQMTTQADLTSVSSENSSQENSAEEQTFEFESSKTNVPKLPKITPMVDERLRNEGRHKMVFAKNESLYIGFS